MDSKSIDSNLNTYIDKELNVLIPMEGRGSRFADKGYVLVDGANKVEGSGQDLINDRNVARMFLGSKE